MSWEWVGSVATGVVGLGGIGATLRAGTKQLTNARLIATEERQQQRLENAYVKLLDFAERIGFWAQTSYPLYDTNPGGPLAPLPPLAEQAQVQALVRAFGSTAVIEIMDAWAKVTQDMLFAEQTIKIEAAEGNKEITGRREFMALRPKEFELRRKIADQVAAELGQRP
ncbi:hypothetical protein R2360_15690 [Mycobacteroides chelonae]|uniref:Uncharacterized protein n=1 Tax=Mycobacteroides chelonae TaxID=1774 RepID=A0AB73U606_MYCCH|nr:hypothetical protein [Mycobacteroides chelonae]MEC4840903.1 hypothetical protein [Mycobacteroides chelonae]MEC4842968.1 hypothetical protein [Mycobacteroides chelonae]OHU45484.1 hypothetical protein BKG81_23845 [Mycobacteroides chelonae]OLT72009.1 hypothetical protein BKG57_23235 [Mycobacteroides chelonae]QDF71623.1 hypothetical protein FJK96_16685 [Mycobacteroides chelonae]